VENSLSEFSNFAEFSQTVENQNCGIRQGVKNLNRKDLLKR